MSRNPRNPFEGFFSDGFDPFDDPFFSQFRQHIDNVFGHNFDINDEQRSIPHQNTNSRKADLSAIIPNTPMIESESSADNVKNDNQSPDVTIYVIDPHRQSPAYDKYTLSDINPNIPNGDGPITHEHYPGFIEKRGNPPGFHHPYFHGFHGVEQPMDFNDNPNQIRSFSRSVIIQRDSDGRTTKTTTIHDGNGQIHTSTEVYDDGVLNTNGFGNEGIMRSFIESMLGMKSLDIESNSTPNQDMFPIKANDKLPVKSNDRKYRMFPMFEQISADPLLRVRNFWNRWKPKFKNSTDIRFGDDSRKTDSWFWGSTSNQNEKHGPNDK